MLDSETTGLKNPVQFVEIAVVDSDAKALFEGTIRPGCRIESGATRMATPHVASPAHLPT